MEQKYIVAMEISGKHAMFTRPDTGDCPVSYGVPTYSAVKGMFESVLFFPNVEVKPTKVKICKPIRYQAYFTNYTGPLNSKKGNKKENYQMVSTILVDVCYKLFAEVAPLRRGREKLSQKVLEADKRTTSPGHAYKAVFERRLRRGTFWHMPFLGLKEFVPDYVGPLRNETAACEEVTMVIPSLLMEVFSEGYKSGVHCTFAQNVKVCKGLLEFPMIGGEK